MSKLLKTIVLLLVIAGVVFVAGCANKTTSNVTQGASVSQTPVSNEGVNQTQVTASVPADTNVTENNIASVNETSGNATENNTSPAVSPNTIANTGQPTENQTVSSAVHLGQAARYQALRKSQQQSGAANGTQETVNVTQ